MCAGIIKNVISRANARGKTDSWKSASRQFGPEAGGVSAVVFGTARDYSMFERTTSIDYELLRTARVMVAPFEVRTRSLAD
jgi:hypothetical protein